MPLAKWLCQIFGLARYDYQKSLEKYIHTLNYPMPDLERLSQLTPYLLTKSMQLKAAGVLVLDRNARSYVLRAAEGEARPLAGTSISQDNPLFLALLEQKKELLLKDTKNEAIAAQMRSLNGELFMPVISKHKYFTPPSAGPTLLGVVYLGQMISGDQFSGKDISFLLGLIKQASHNLETAFMHEEMRNTPSPSGRGQL